MRHHGLMERDWSRLAEALKRARRATGLTQRQIADKIGVSRGPIQAIERGEPVAKPTGTMRSYARAVGWTDDSIEAVLAGGDPTHVAADQPAEDEQVMPASDLPLRIVQELSEGVLLDSTVLDLTPLGSTARMVVVARGAPDASPEEVRRDLLALSEAYRRIRQIPGEGDTGTATATGS